MTVRLAAPYPGIQFATYLPSPEFSDFEALVNEFTLSRAMDGTPYTYIKPKDGRRRLQMRFSLTRQKALELREFISFYIGEEILITDHKGVKFRGFFMTNPNEFESVTPRVGLQHHQQITLEFEAQKLP